MLMPPSYRVIDMPFIKAMIGENPTNHPDHMRYICIRLFNELGLEGYLPFNDSFEIWDIEPAFKEKIYSLLYKARQIYLEPKVIIFNEEEIVSFFSKGRPSEASEARIFLRHSLEYIHRVFGECFYNSVYGELNQTIVRLPSFDEWTDDDNDQDDENEDEEENQELYFSLTYKITKVVRMVESREINLRVYSAGSHEEVIRFVTNEDHKSVRRCGISQSHSYDLDSIQDVEAYVNEDPSENNVLADFPQDQLLELIKQEIRNHQTPQ